MARTSGAKARTPAGGKRRTPRAPSPLPDELEDEVDRFHRQREQVALQAPHPSRLDALGGSEDELDEEEVMALAGSSEEELDTDEEVEPLNENEDEDEGEDVDEDEGEGKEHGKVKAASVAPHERA